mmetsp:Transcript_9824/g.11203  ORF Transcript_9824/g.11203 Transcript_9824/m.11203 type:complete len:208 (-) Transcript_9824:107-730(-)
MDTLTTRDNTFNFHSSCSSQNTLELFFISPEETSSSSEFKVFADTLSLPLRSISPKPSDSFAIGINPSETFTPVPDIFASVTIMLEFIWELLSTEANFLGGTGGGFFISVWAFTDISFGNFLGGIGGGVLFVASTAFPSSLREGSFPFDSSVSTFIDSDLASTSPEEIFSSAAEISWSFSLSCFEMLSIRANGLYSRIAIFETFLYI